MSMHRFTHGPGPARPRPFRFGSTSFRTARSDVLADARKAEGLGFGTFALPDHFDFPLSTIPALMMVADNFPGLRVATCVLCNDFRHPLVTARDAATLDVLSDGRLELGLGAGYVASEYEMAGLAFDPGQVRLQRLTEAVQIAKMAFAGQAFSFKGEHYEVHNCIPTPVPVQRPGPPLLLGGGGRRLLSLAATEADIVSVLPASARAGLLRASQLGFQAFKDKVDFVRQVAGERGADLEIHVLVFDGALSTDRRAAAEAFLGQSHERLHQFAFDAEVTIDDLLGSPYFAFGTVEEVTEHLLRMRQETGASYFVVFPHLTDMFGQVIDRLANT
ncbi:MAG TPA: TIGR03621 family F420-dependent LLM class oxidoreductase [Acidimicrobiales bacterium]|nr:TIGR03621 family F420-dependent LLM class oxidoreductase [Acidimicrobiales bacterium]